jgi:hypothetical protein
MRLEALFELFICDKEKEKHFLRNKNLQSILIFERIYM